jgi:hypothetical protein
LINDLKMAQEMKRLFTSGFDSLEAAHEANAALARLFDEMLLERDISSARPFAKMNLLFEAEGMPPLPLWQIICEVAMAHRLAGSFLPSAGEESK